MQLPCRSLKAASGFCWAALDPLWAGGSPALAPRLAWELKSWGQAACGRWRACPRSWGLWRRPLSCRGSGVSSWYWASGDVFTGAFTAGCSLVPGAGVERRMKGVSVRNVCFYRCKETWKKHLFSSRERECVCCGLIHPSSCLGAFVAPTCAILLPVCFCLSLFSFFSGRF